jgi:hypothetical protein
MRNFPVQSTKPSLSNLPLQILLFYNALFSLIYLFFVGGLAMDKVSQSASCGFIINRIIREIILFDFFVYVGSQFEEYYSDNWNYPLGSCRAYQIILWIHRQYARKCFPLIYLSADDCFPSNASLHISGVPTVIKNPDRSCDQFINVHFSRKFFSLG